jgi:hypothetical protein
VVANPAKARETLGVGARDETQLEEEELDRIAKLTDDELEGELRSWGVDPAALTRSAEPLMLRMEVRVTEAAPFVRGRQRLFLWLWILAAAIAGVVAVYALDHHGPAR